MSDTVAQPETYEAIHHLAVRMRPSPLAPADMWLVEHGLARAAGTGYELTGKGYRLHRALLEEERAALNLAALEANFASVSSLGQRLRRISASWERPGEPSRQLVASLLSCVSTTEALLDQAAGIAPRFGAYRTRLADARRQIRAGDLRYGTGSEVDSVAGIWNEIHEDYLQTLGRGYDLEAL